MPPVPNTVGKHSFNISKMPKSMFSGAGSPDFRLIGMQQETLKKQQIMGMNDTEGTNPFKLQKNFEGILVNREKERYLNKMQKEALLRGYINP